MTKKILPAGLTIGLLLLPASRTQAQTPLGTAFTYQGTNINIIRRATA